MTGHTPWREIKHKNDSPEKREHIAKIARRLRKLIERNESNESRGHEDPRST